jgi:hypothetical protein
VSGINWHGFFIDAVPDLSPASSSIMLLARARALLLQTGAQVESDAIEPGGSFFHLHAPLSMHDEITAELVYRFARLRKCRPNVQPATGRHNY